MPYQAQALDTVEPFSDTDWEVSANVGLYNVVSGCALTYDASDMTVDIAAGVVTHNGSAVAVAAQANAVTLVSDGSNPRWAWIYIDSSGSGGITHGTAAATPTKPEGGDNVILGVVLIATSATIANDQTKIDKRVPQAAGPLHVATEQFVESGVNAIYSAIGGYPGDRTVSNGDAVGLGWAAAFTGSGVAVRAGAGAGWALGTLATQNSDAGLVGMQVTEAQDWTLLVRATLEAITMSGDDIVLVGGIQSPTDFSDQNDIIAFRIDGTGNVVAVTDSGGAETATDTSITGVAEHTYRIEVRSNGATVAFYIDDNLVATHTTNIPSTTFFLVIGVTNISAASARQIRVRDGFSWMEV